MPWPSCAMVAIESTHGASEMSVYVHRERERPPNFVLIPQLKDLMSHFHFHLQIHDDEYMLQY